MYSNGVSLFPLVVAEPSSSYESGKAVERWIEVLVDFVEYSKEVTEEKEEKEEKLYTYRVPDGLNVKPGDILSVPFGVQQL